MARPPGSAPLPRRKIDFDRLGNKLLVALYQHYMDSTEFFVGFDQIRSMIPNEPTNAIWDELRTQISSDTVIQKTEQRTESNFFAAAAGGGRPQTYAVAIDGYKITKKGIGIVNGMTDTSYEVYSSEVRFPIQRDKSDSEIWEPLPIDRQSTEFKKAIEASEAAISEIEASNGYAVSNPEERNSIVETLRGSLKVLKEGLISKGQLLEGLIRPLRFIAIKFADASLGELAKRAASFLISLIS